MQTTINEHVRAGEDMPRCAYIFSKNTPKGIPLPLHVLPGPDHVAPALRAVCEAMDAWGIIQISEVWALPLEGLDKEAAEAKSREWAGRVHTHPDRVEQVMVVWEYKKEQGMMMAKTVLEDGKRAVGEWVDSRDTKGASFTGRLTSLLPGARGN